MAASCNAASFVPQWRLKRVIQWLGQSFFDPTILLASSIAHTPTNGNAGDSTWIYFGFLGL